MFIAVIVGIADIMFVAFVATSVFVAKFDTALFKSVFVVIFVKSTFDDTLPIILLYVAAKSFFIVLYIERT